MCMHVCMGNCVHVCVLLCTCVQVQGLVWGDWSVSDVGGSRSVELCRFYLSSLPAFGVGESLI